MSLHLEIEDVESYSVVYNATVNPSYATSSGSAHPLSGSKKMIGSYVSCHSIRVFDGHVGRVESERF